MVVERTKTMEQFEKLANAGYTLMTADEAFAEADFEELSASVEDNSFSHAFGTEVCIDYVGEGEGEVVLTWYSDEEPEFPDELVTSRTATTPEPDYEALAEAGCRRLPSRYRHCGKEVEAEIKGTLVRSSSESMVIEVEGDPIRLWKAYAVYEWSAE